MYNEDSFFVVNKLVEFAKSGAVQNSMIASMNEAIAAMRIPGVDNPIRGTAEKPEEEKQNED